MKTPRRALFSQYPLIQIAVAYSFGILASYYLGSRLSLSIACAALSSAATLFLLVRNQVPFAGVTLFLSVFFCGGILLTFEDRAQQPDSLKRLLYENQLEQDTPVVLTGTIADPPLFARGRIYLTLTAEAVGTKSSESKVSGLVSILASFKDEAGEQAYRDLRLEYGTRIAVKAILTWSDKYRNPGVSTLTEYLDRKGYEATGFVKSPRLITRLNDPRAFRPLAWLYKWRDQLQSRIDSLFSAETAGVLDAALLGNRYNLSRTTAERFRVGGTFHVLVISGLHISFLGGVVFVAVKALTKNRLVQFGLSNIVVWAYSLVVGAESSVSRAALMFSFVTFSAVVFRSASSLNALGGAALVLLVWNPKNIFDPSLQLTFLSVLAIVVIAWPLLRNLYSIGSWRPTRTLPYPPSCSRPLKALSDTIFWSERDWTRELARSAHQYRVFKAPAALALERLRLQRWVRYVFAAIVVSCSVQLVLLPLLIIYFHRLSFSSLVLNIVVSLMLAALTAVSLSALLASLVSKSLAITLAQCANWINWLMVHSVDPFSQFGVASMRLPEYSRWAQTLYILYFVPLLILAVALNRWDPLALPILDKAKSKLGVLLGIVAQLVVVSLALLHPFSAPQPDGKLHVDFLDVGQGDSALVTMPDGTTLLVDGGGRPNFLNASKNVEEFERETRSIGESVVSEYLWWQGFSAIDYVLATHADADHIDGLCDVLRNFSVRSAIVGRTPMSDAEYTKFAETLSQTGTPLTVIQAGDKLSLGGVEIDVLWPTATPDQNAASRNNDSAVIRLKLGKRVILLTGDIEKETEQLLLQDANNLRADVIKVPHHGSRTSSTQAFVTATHSSLAIISVGQTSMFGHPHKEVVDRWKSQGAEVLTTGNCGTISLTTDGKNLSVESFVSCGNY